MNLEKDILAASERYGDVEALQSTMEGLDRLARLYDDRATSARKRAKGIGDRPLMQRKILAYAASLDKMAEEVRAAADRLLAASQIASQRPWREVQ